jgi:hypothetical protein
MPSAANAFTGATNGNTFTPTCSMQVPAEPFNVSVYGTFVGTVVLEKTFDNGTNYIPVMHPATNTAVSFTAPGAIVLHEPEISVQYRFRCSAFTSGTINTRLSN